MDSDTDPIWLTLSRKAVACFLLDRCLDPLGVGDSQVITHDLDVRLFSEVRPRGPIILVMGILNGDNLNRKQSMFIFVILKKNLNPKYKTYHTF